ncbi:MAG: hypothetical protein P8Y96_11770 [Desulfuromonadales bacterium]
MSQPDFRKYAAMIGFWALCMLIIIGGSIYYKSYQGTAYDERAVPYINQVLPILSQWDPAKTKDLMVPEIVATIPADKFARAMDFFSQLGRLQKFDKPEFKEAFVDEETELGSQTIVEYTIDAVYDTGEAEVNLKLLEKGPSYQIYGFTFSAEALMPEQP